MLHNCNMWIHDHEKMCKRLLFIALMLTGIIVRIWEFGVIPSDINQDEAFAGFEAYSLLHYGVDSSGYAFPVYFTTWGSGMNALEIYLMIPFIFLFGLNTFAIRMPQVIVACFTLWVIYLLTKKIFQSNLCFTALFLTAIMPWHIMLSRWGLESNLAPSFLIFGLYFFVLGIERSRFYILSALFYGLSLYCYATIWLIVPFILLFQILYCAWYKKIRFCRETLTALLILFVLALPLLLFLLINRGILPEIKTSFFSIPKLVAMRSNEISLHGVGSHFKNLCSILFYQSDNYIVNAARCFGIFYPITLPLFFIGLFFLLYDIITHCREGKFNAGLFVVIHFAASFFLGLLIEANITKINSLFLPMIIITSYGLHKLFPRFKKIFILILISYFTFFICFTNYYFTDYKDEVSEHFYYGCEEMITKAQGFDGTIYVTRNLPYPIVLFYSKEDVTAYIDTVQYNNYPSIFLDVDGFTRYSFHIDLNNLDEQALYLLDDSYDSSIFVDAGFSISHSDGTFWLAYKR